MIDPETCPHAKMLPTFDEEAAKALQANCKHTITDPLDAMFGICAKCKIEIRKKWPRGEGTCTDCGSSVIAYASHAHYIVGDW